MNTFNLVQLSMNLAGLIRFYSKVWPIGCPALNDKHMLVKTAMTEIFVGTAVIRPWRIHSMDEYGNLMILGYSGADSDKLKALLGLALPGLAAAFTPDDIFSMPVRGLSCGDRIQIETTVCPKKMVRLPSNPSKKVEVDIYTHDKLRREREGLPGISREEAYEAFIRSRLEPKVDIESFKTLSITGAVVARKSGTSVPMTSVKQASVSVRMTCSVKDPDGLRDLMISGIGRSRSYGHGMVLVRAGA
jgi:hypothetical protein